ncbi:MAG: ribosomal protein S18-alanine N-acetyltransferase [Spirochaetota bacterium]|nr:ribosomal protein S18-alanine N-acetyltransferase [Spirochaetota bacterium]
MPNKKILIRKALYEDIENIAALDAYVFRENAWSTESFTRELDLHFSRLFIAEIDNKFAGYALAWYIADEVQLMRIAVLPDFQRYKVGTQLIQHVINHTDNQKKIVLEVADNNTSAIRFYTSLGFHSVGFRKNYYRFDNAILMEKNINHED